MHTFKIFTYDKLPHEAKTLKGYPPFGLPVMHHTGHTPDGMGMDRHREKRNMQEAARERTDRVAEERRHKCRSESCGAVFNERKEECPECGYSDENSSHGATQVVLLS